MISYKHNLIFVHIPKTGGTSIEDIIWPSKKDRTEKNLWMGYVRPYYNKYQTGGMQHLLATQIRQEVGAKMFDQCFKFTIVRNPWDKVISQFMYIKKRQDVLDFIGMEKDDCLKTYLSLIQKCTYVQSECQYKFFLDENGEQLVDYIGRFENFTEEVKTILKKKKLDRTLFGLRERKIPHKMKSQRKPYQDYFDDESAQMVQHIYSKDIELLNYQF